MIIPFFCALKMASYFWGVWDLSQIVHEIFQSQVILSNISLKIVEDYIFINTNISLSLQDRGKASKLFGTWNVLTEIFGILWNRSIRVDFSKEKDFVKLLGWKTRDMIAVVVRERVNSKQLLVNPAVQNLALMVFKRTFPQIHPNPKLQRKQFSSAN